jgi:phosphonate transport system ATP-binding protein
VLSEIGFTVTAGEVVAILGPSGAGKTTLFRYLARLIEADQGEIYLLEHSIRGMRSSELRRARRDIGLVFQQHNLIRRRSALDNVLAGRLGHVPLWRVMARRFGQTDRQRAFAALDRVDLLEFAERRADRLSGGQQQRVWQTNRSPVSIQPRLSRCFRCCATSRMSGASPYCAACIR